MKTNKKYLSLVLLFIFSLAMLPPFVLAGNGMWDNQVGLGKIEGGDIGDAFGGPVGQQRDIRYMMMDFINVFLGFLALIFIILILWGGFRWMTAAGNEDRVTSAKSTLRSGIIGFVIVASALVIANFVYFFVRTEVWGEPF